MSSLAATKQQLAEFYLVQRNKTEELCQPLTIEDYVIQSTDDVSPPKWHLAHTTWFFEMFILKPKLNGYELFHPLFHHLFNSYYQRLGDPYPRVRRGLLSRPTVKTVYAYREYVNKYITELIEQQSETALQILKPLIILGLHHEQQHQELLLMDIKHNFSLNLDFPVYQQHSLKQDFLAKVSDEFINVKGGVVEIGYHENDFCFDNELPRHQQILKPYSIAKRLVTNAEYAEFIAVGGYQKPEWWLADGWECVQKNNWYAPLYWHYFDNKWHIFTLNGLQELNPAEPVSHVSYYEADAYARWCDKRLPTEAEWEHVVTGNHIAPTEGNFLESKFFHPQVKKTSAQFFGDVWEWTTSSYCAYPGYKPPEGALGEYNGKFMSNQIVLRGGSCVTPQSHIRASYRNFFQPDKRWQFSGIRLASDI